jgi:hypothetical protein
MPHLSPYFDDKKLREADRNFKQSRIELGGRPSKMVEITEHASPASPLVSASRVFISVLL